MSFQGHASYANQLENRVISQNWTSHWRRQGRMVFRRIYGTAEMNPIGYRQRTTVGFEMVSNAARSRWAQNRQSTDTSEWLFRCYHDGTGLYKKNLIEATLNRYNTSNAISEVVFKHYYRDAVIHNDEEHSWDAEIILLRRKPLSTYARMASEKDNNLGDFLLRKYNLGGERETVSH